MEQVHESILEVIRSACDAISRAVNGLNPPADCTAEFRSGWQAACAAMARSPEIVRLTAALAQLRQSIAKARNGSRP